MLLCILINVISFLHRKLFNHASSSDTDDDELDDVEIPDVTSHKNVDDKELNPQETNGFSSSDTRSLVSKRSNV